MKPVSRALQSCSAGDKLFRPGDSPAGLAWCSLPVWSLLACLLGLSVLWLKVPDLRTAAQNPWAEEERQGGPSLFWGDGILRERDSLRRFYPEGTVTMQFAFRAHRTRPVSALRLDATEGLAEVRIRELLLYCLGE